MPSYTRSNLYSDLGVAVSSITDIDRIVNRVIRDVISEVDVRSTKRRAYLSPNLHDKLFDYQAPADLKGWSIIDIRRIEGRQKRDKFVLTSSEYFDRLKEDNKNLICIEDREFLPKLRISAYLSEDADQVVIHGCESLTANGTWSVELDASNLTLDKDNFVNGDASLNFDMDQAGTSTTVGIIVNSDFTAVDLSDYDDGVIFVYVYATTVTGLDGFTLRLGNDASNYYSQQVTVTNENLAFHTGWMLLRFDMATLKGSVTGTVSDSAIDYFRLAIDKGNDSLQSKDWRLDYIVARRGVATEVWYYTKYGWQSSTGTYLENSTADTDKINCDTEEYELYILKGKELVAEQKKSYDDANYYRNRYEIAKKVYKERYPSERLLIHQTYYDFGSDYTEETVW